MSGGPGANRFIVLLRGINVGGHKRVPMAELRSVLGEAGFTEVTTYIQSGNIIVETADGDGETDVVARVEQTVTESFGFAVPVVARAAVDWANVLADNPFPHNVDQPKFLHVYFCDQAPPAEGLERLGGERYRPDKFMAVDRQVYVFYPEGAARSKLTTNELEKQLGVTATGRNYSTVSRLHEMLA